jgi:hypothetical protein
MGPARENEFPGQTHMAKLHHTLIMKIFCVNKTHDFLKYLVHVHVYLESTYIGAFFIVTPK